VGTLTSLLGFVTAAAVVIGGIIAYLLRRRGTTGRVATSDAATLWAQSQQMYAQVLAEKTRAEDQRDRVMAIQSSQVMPVLTATDESLRQILAALGQIQDTLAQLGAGRQQ
jgi:predicted nucleic acid-binding Zn ribbon protein